VLLLDASVWVASASPRDQYHSESASLVRRHRSAIGALDLTLFEVANALGAKRRQPRGAERLASLVVRCCGRDRLVRVDPNLVGAAVDVAVEHGLSAYDAAYVAVARRNGW